MATEPTARCRRAPRALGAIAAGSIILFACSSGSSKVTPSASSGSGSSSSSSSAAPGTSQATTVTGVDPNAPDVNAAGDIPDTQVYVSVTDADGPFTIKVPEGWSNTTQSGISTYTDNFNSVQLRVVAAASATTETSARQNEVASIQSATPGFQLDSVSTVQRKAGSAVLITYKADSAPNAVTGKVVKLAVERYEFWQGGKEAIVVLAGPVGADNVDPWKIVTDSFVWS
jgi:hypothetical protein